MDAGASALRADPPALRRDDSPRRIQESDFRARGPGRAYPLDWQGDGPRSWAVDFLVDRSVPRPAAIAAVAAYRVRLTVPAALGMLSAFRLPKRPTGRGLVGLLVTGARRRWLRRVDDREVSYCAIFAESWPDVSAARTYMARARF